MFILLLLMVLFNLLCLFNKNILLFLSLLVFLSFYSMFLILYSYGTGFKVLVVVLFKGLADVLILLLISNILFLDLSCQLDSFMFCGLDLGILLLLIFLIYSLFGVFGFWLFWAMEASYFISCFMHSCGFIAVGLIFFIKLSLLGVLDGLVYFISFVNIISLLSYLFFLVLFFIVKDCKKSFGFYSVSSICFLLFTSVNFPLIAISYFFISSIVKVLIFEMLSFINKVDGVRWLLCLLFVFNIFTYSLFFLVSPVSHYLIEVIYFILLLKVFSLLVFLFKVFNMLELKFIGIGFNPIVFIMLGLVFNKLLCLIFFNSWLSSSLSYMFLFMLLLKFNFCSFKVFKVCWLKVCDSFFIMVCTLSNLILAYVRMLDFSPHPLFKILRKRFISLNNAQLVFYCMFIAIAILLII